MRSLGGGCKCLLTSMPSMHPRNVLESRLPLLLATCSRVQRFFALMTRKTSVSSSGKTMLTPLAYYTLVPSQPLDTASARTFCANVALDILESLPTTLADDEATWSAVRQATSEADGGSRIRLPEGVSKAAYLAALEYRMEAKRILHRFAADCTSRPGIID